MAKSYEYGKKEIKEYLQKIYNRNSTILDVGAGEGTYYNLLSDWFTNKIDAVEVFKPNIEEYKLEEKYNQVFNADIKDFRYSYYDIIIFGDIIEHLEVNEAQEVLKYAYSRCKEVVVAVPYKYKQGIINNNIYEIHKQDDLTPEIMKERYPFLKLLYGNKEYGYYVKRRNE